MADPSQAVARAGRSGAPLARFLEQHFIVFNYEALPDGRYRTLKGQGHDIAPAVVGPVSEEFFLTPSLRNKSGDL